MASFLAIILTILGFPVFRLTAQANKGKGASTSRSSNKQSNEHIVSGPGPVVAHPTDRTEPSSPGTPNGSNNDPGSRKRFSVSQVGGPTNLLAVHRPHSSTQLHTYGPHDFVHTYQSISANDFTPMQRWLHQDITDDPYHTIGFVQGGVAGVASVAPDSSGFTEHEEASDVKSRGTWGGFNDAQQG